MKILVGRSWGYFTCVVRSCENIIFLLSVFSLWISNLGASPSPPLLPPALFCLGKTGRLGQGWGRAAANRRLCRCHGTEGAASAGEGEHEYDHGSLYRRSPGCYYWRAVIEAILGTVNGSKISVPYSSGRCTQTQHAHLLSIYWL